MQRAGAARVRTAALGTTVGLCLLIPLAAASADSAHEKAPTAGAKPTPAPSTSGPAKPAGHDFGNGVAPGSAEGLDAVKQLLGTTTPPPSTAAPAPAGSAAATNALCGKAVEIGGVRAQTCVERDGGEVWARTYYRNQSPDALLLVLGVMRPGNGADAGTVQVSCDIDAKSGEGQCETPRLRTDQPLSAWSAVAEIATADASRKVLRSGTASAAG